MFQTWLSLFKNPIPENYLTATHLYVRPPTKGVQLFEEVAEGQMKVDAVGRPLPHLSAAKQATGEAVYIDDMVPCSGQTFIIFISCISI